MIKMDVCDNEKQHLVIQANEPSRIEVSVTETGLLIVDVYKGVENDIEQDPIGCFIGKEDNKSWECNL